MITTKDTKDTKVFLVVKIVGQVSIPALLGKTGGIPIPPTGYAS